MGPCYTKFSRTTQRPDAATPSPQPRAAAPSPPTTISLPPHNPETNWYRTYSVAHRFCVVEQHVSVHPLTRDGKIFPIAPDNYLLWAVRSETNLIGVTAFGCVVLAEFDKSRELYYYSMLAVPARAAIPVPADVLITLAEKFIATEPSWDSQGIKKFLTIVGQLQSF